MYSQSQEELWILKHAGGAGHFLDVGAADGKTFSNTYALAERGWTGVCVEPSPRLAAALIKNHPDENKIQIIIAALGLERKITRLWATDDFVSTTDQQLMKKWSKAMADHAPYRKIMVQQITWDDVMPLGPFGMINIDTEGTSLALFDAMPKAMLDAARIVCVEHNGDLAGLHVPAGWRGVYQSSENTVLVKGG